MRSVSLRKCFSLPICLTQGFSEVLPSAASLSLTASVTTSRSGIPRLAAVILARRKMRSGISKVVFMTLCSHIYGRSSTLSGSCGPPEPHGDKTVRRDVGLEKFLRCAGAAEDGFGGEVAAAHGPFHRGGPARGRPILPRGPP